MKQSEKERRERRQRMLAREQGGPRTGPTAPTPTRPPTPPTRRFGTLGAPNLPKRQPGTVAARKPPRPRRPVSPVLRRRRRRPLVLLVALVVAVVLAIAVATGAVRSVAAWAGDTWDSAYLYFNRKGGGWPAQTGLQGLTASAPLAGGFVLMDSEDVVVYSAYGSLTNSIQPGYARPALAVGNTRFVVYSRAGTELRVESRTETLYTRSFDSGLMLCALSNNGTLAVVTQSDRYAAVLQVMDADMRDIITYSLAQADGVPVALAFADDNRRLATGTVAALDGRMNSMVYVMDTRADELGPRYTADAGSLILRLEWLSGSRLLAVFDTYAAVLDTNGNEVGRYDYGGAVLQSVSTAGRHSALLLAIRGGNQLILLDDSLTPLAEIAAGQATAVTATHSAVYLIEGEQVLCYGYDGALRWQQKPEHRPLAVLDAAQTLLVSAGVVQPLTAPEE